MPRKDGPMPVDACVYVCMRGYGSAFNSVLQREGEPHVSRQRLFQDALLAMF